MSKVRPRFTIGEHVKVSAVAKFYYTMPKVDDNFRAKGPSHRVVEREPRELHGWIVGARTRFLGTYKRSSYHSSYDGEEVDPPYLEVKGSVLVWLVATSMTNLPIEVLDADAQRADSQEWPPTIPWVVVKQCPWTEKDREFMRQVAKDTPRDNRGRFIKTPISVS